MTSLSSTVYKILPLFQCMWLPVTLRSLSQWCAHNCAIKFLAFSALMLLVGWQEGHLAYK